MENAKDEVVTFLALNNVIMPAAQACLPVTTEGVRYGSGCFETIAWTKGQPRFWQRHMERFTRSCQRLGFTPKVEPPQLRRLLGELAARNAIGQEGVARISAHQCGAQADVVLTLSLPRYASAPESLRLVLSPQAHPGKWAFCGIKHNNYVPFLAAHAAAVAAGFDEAVLADGDGYLLEGSRTNLFALERAGAGWRLRTAPLELGVLPGILRGVVLELAPTLGLAVSEAPFTADELRGAEACFVTNALLGVVRVAAFGAHRFRCNANCNTDGSADGSANSNADGNANSNVGGNADIAHVVQTLRQAVFGLQD